MLCEDWCTVEDVIGTGDSGGDACGPCTPVGDAPPLDEATVAQAIALASEVLYGLTGEQYGGLCTQAVRPCARQRCGGTRRRPIYAVPAFGSWNGWECDCPGSCSCTRLQRIKLPAWPVQTVTQVLVGGVALDPAAYRIDEQRWLTRIDGEAWPACQDLTLPATEADTFEVTFTSGDEIPPGGVAAASKYACELGRSWCGQECELPSKVEAITRQGVSVSFQRADQLIGSGGTGIPTVDTWIRAVNGGDGQIQTPALIASPWDFPPLAYRPGQPGG